MLVPSKNLKNPKISNFLQNHIWPLLWAFKSLWARFWWFQQQISTFLNISGTSLKNVIFDQNCENGQKCDFVTSISRARFDVELWNFIHKEILCSSPCVSRMRSKEYLWAEFWVSKNCQNRVSGYIVTKIKIQYFDNKLAYWGPNVCNEYFWVSNIA